LPVAAIESAYAIAYGSNQPNISGQHILNCQGTWECVGGIPSDAFQFAASGGVLSDYMVPYTGVKDATNCGPAARRRLAASFPPDLWFDRALEDHRASTQGSSLQQQSPSGGLASSARRHASNFAPSLPALLAPPASPADSFTPPHPPPPPYTAPSRLSELSFKGHPPESPLHSPPPLPPPPPSVFSNLLSSLFQILAPASSNHHHCLPPPPPPPSPPPYFPPLPPPSAHSPPPLDRPPWAKSNP
ncbi:hypothetical protein CLOM_g10842, partial [Closterium sp. NIES-68]